MTNLKDTLIADLFQNGAKHNPEIIALSYAAREEKRRIIAEAEKTLLMAAMDNLDERMLDYLAVELRTPAYRDTYPIETKRALVKGTLPYYMKLGTPLSIKWVLDTIFEDGIYEEWYEYGGEPHHFRVTIGTHDKITPENLDDFRKIIASVKRLSSWIDDIISQTALDAVTLYVGPVFHETRTETKLPYLEPKLQAPVVYISSRFAQNIMTTKLPSIDKPIKYSFGRTVYTAGATHTWSATKLPDLPEFETQVEARALLKATGATHSWAQTNIPKIEEE